MFTAVRMHLHAPYHHLLLRKSLIQIFFHGLYWHNFSLVLALMLTSTVWPDTCAGVVKFVKKCQQFCSLSPNLYFSFGGICRWICFDEGVGRPAQLWRGRLDLRLLNWLLKVINDDFIVTPYGARKAADVQGANAAGIEDVCSKSFKDELPPVFVELNLF